MTGERLEEIRSRFFPERGVRVLMLGESPPPGRGFFYSSDSTLYRVSVPVFVAECGFSSGCQEFLEAFAAGGFYLDDFSSERGDHPSERPTDPKVRKAVSRIGGLIAEHRPKFVLGVLDRIESLVAEAIDVSRLPETPGGAFPFPTTGVFSFRAPMRRAFGTCFGK